ncbi:MAG: hypothetical protein ACR2QS_07060 [Woeseiaceae bacterium]
MLKSINSKLMLTAIIASFSLYGCGGSDDEPAQAVDLAAAGEILQYVPADSPYVMANLAPLPDDVMDKLEPSIDRVLAAYETILQEVLVMATEEAEQNGESAEESAKAAAVIGELSSLMSMDGLRGAGIDRESRVVLYGNGLLPVLRFEVSDGALFDAALARIEESADEKMDVATISGNPVRYIVAEEVKVLVSVLDTQVVITLAPSEFDEDQLSTLLGFNEPADSIVNSGKLQGIADKYSFSDYFLGYFDLEAIAKTVTGDAQGLDADIFALHGQDDELTDVCRAEIREMAAISPRMVMGYTNISTSRFDSQVIVEMRSDIAEGLSALSAPVPGLDGDMGGLLSFGMSLDVQSLRDFIETQIDAIEADPFECEEFAEIQAGAAEARSALQQPVMPMIYDFRGFVAVLEDIQGLDMAAKTPPTSIEGQFLFAMKDAPALVAMGTMFSPELAALDLQPNGEVTLLDLPQAQMLGEAVYVAMNDDALSMSIGDGAETKLGDMLEAEASDNGTVFNFSVDANRYYTFIGEAMTQAEPDPENPMSPEFQAAMQDVMLAIADMYDRMTVDMRFTEDGVVFDSVVMLGE